MRILVVIPTTAGPLTIRSLKPRPALPASAAFAEGDYRPLPWSGDYARLVGPGGPLARDGAAPPHAYELRLSGSFDAGRSWEAPVALAHGLTARGHSLVAEPAAAEMIVWATGALDLDLQLIPARYALLDKIDGTQALFDAAPQARVAVLLPPDDARDAAWERLGAMLAGRLLALDGQDMPAVVVQIDATAVPATASVGEASTSRSFRGSVRAVGFLVAALLVALAAAAAFLGGLQPATTAKPPQPPPSEAERSEPAPDPVPAPPPAVLAPIIVEELRAPAGQSCRAVAFAAAAPVRKEVALAAPLSFETSRNDAGLCGLSFRARDARMTNATTGFEVSPNLRAMTVMPSRLPNGEDMLFFRDGVRQNVVYTVQISILEGGVRKVSEPFTHTLAP